MNSSPQRVAVVGLGIMGSAISKNLIAAGFPVAGFDIDPARLAALAAAGGAPCGSTAEAARDSVVLLTSLPSAEALDATVAALAATPARGLVVAELSTLPIAAKEAARGRLAAVGIAMLDCPLSGTGAQAATRDLALYGSGDAAAFDRCRAVFEGFARSLHYLGAFGNGSRMKFVANLLVAVHNVAAAEALVLAAQAGLDLATVLQVIARGAGTSKIFELRGPMMVAGSYRPPTATMHVLQKDSAIIAEFARSLGVSTPMLAAAAPLYDEAAALGFEADDVAAVHAVLAGRAASAAAGK